MDINHVLRGYGFCARARTGSLKIHRYFPKQTGLRQFVLRRNSIMSENRLILILGLAGFVVMADNWVVSPILPAIAHSFKIAPVRAGLLITAYMLPFGIFQLLFGPLSDRYGKRQVIAFSMTFFTIGSALCALGLSLFDLAFYRAITGVFAASVMPISLALIGDTVPLQRRQQAIGTFLGIGFLGQGLSMAVGGSIAYFVNWRGVFITYAVFSLIPTTLLFVLGRKVSSKKNPHSRILKPFVQLLNNKRSLSVYLVVFIEGVLVLGSFSYLGVYTDFLFHYNYLTIGLILTAFGVGAVITGRLVGRLAPRVGRLNTLTMGLISAIIADGLLFGLTRQPALLVVAVAILGIGFMLIHSTLLTIATEFAQAARGTAMSLVAFCFMGGGGIGTVIGGRLISSYGYSHFYGIYGLLLVGLLVVARLAIKTAVGQAAVHPAWAASRTPSQP
jgi:predicted MFS family arabinose efflux permease